MLNFHSQLDCYTAMLYSQVILLNMSTGHNSTAMNTIHTTGKNSAAHCTDL